VSVEEAMAMISGIILAGVVSWFLLSPLFEMANGLETSDGNTAQSLLEQKERCLQVIKDLELDHSTNKISEEDYQRTRGTLVRELAQLMKKLDSL
jgi:hypothetical protein